MPKISQIIAREILNSRGHPTIESSVLCDNGAYGTASVPSGSSTGQNECLEIRDEDERYLGMGVLKAVNNIVSMIAPKLKGIEVEDQTKIDEAMINLDGYPDKSKLGANAILAVSIACLKAAAADAARLRLDQAQHDLNRHRRVGGAAGDSGRAHGEERF